MAHFISNFKRLQPLLQKVVLSEVLTKEDKLILTSFQNSSTYKTLPKSSEAANSASKTNLFLLRQATDSLLMFAKGDNRRALEVAKATQNLKLRVDPFRGFFYCFADKVAQLVGDEEASKIFANRYKMYRENYALENALLGAAQVSDPKVQDLLGEMLVEDSQAQNQLYDSIIHASLDNSQEVGFMPPASGLTYIYRAEEEQQNPTVRIFTEPRLARFVDFETQLINIEPNYEFLEFSLELSPQETAADLLASLQDTAWILRLITDLKEEPLSFLGDHLEITSSFNTLHITLEQPKNWQELSLVEEINWEKFWFGLIAIVFIPRKS